MKFETVLDAWLGANCAECAAETDSNVLYGRRVKLQRSTQWRRRQADRFRAWLLAHNVRQEERIAELEYEDTRPAGEAANG